MHLYAIRILRMVRKSLKSHLNSQIKLLKFQPKNGYFEFFQILRPDLIPFACSKMMDFNLNVVYPMCTFQFCKKNGEKRRKRGQKMALKRPYRTEKNGKNVTQEEEIAHGLHTLRSRRCM